MSWWYCKFIEPREKVEVVVAENSLSLEQLNVHLGIHISDHVVKVLKISAADLS